MLSESNERILRQILKSGNVVFMHALPEGITPIRLESLSELGFLHPIIHPAQGLIGYQLLPAGEDALSEAEQIRQQRAAEKAEQDLQNHLADERWRKDAHRSWMQFTITTILSIATFIAGAVVEKHTCFIERIFALFH